jgi:hypothetical protein
MAAAMPCTSACSTHIPNRREEGALQIHTQVLAAACGFFFEPWEFVS